MRWEHADKWTFVDEPTRVNAIKDSDTRCRLTSERQRAQDNVIGIPRVTIIPARVIKDLEMPDPRIGDMDNRNDPDRKNPERHEYPARKDAANMRKYPRVMGPGIYKPIYDHDFPVTPYPDSEPNKKRFALWAQTKAGRKALKG